MDKVFGLVRDNKAIVIGGAIAVGTAIVAVGAYAYNRFNVVEEDAPEGYIQTDDADTDE